MFLVEITIEIYWSEAKNTNALPAKNALTLWMKRLLKWRRFWPMLSATSYKLGNLTLGLDQRLLSFMYGNSSHGDAVRIAGNSNDKQCCWNKKLTLFLIASVRMDFLTSRRLGSHNMVFSEILLNCPMYFVTWQFRMVNIKHCCSKNNRVQSF